jgi:tRNA threonylcarbamoyladenosine modification (KEOPS) complex  Pcc1 subunit
MPRKMIELFGEAVLSVRVSDAAARDRSPNSLMRWFWMALAVIAVTATGTF